MYLIDNHPTSEMERISSSYLSENADLIIDRIETENVGFVITEDGKDKCVMCPVNWFEPELETIELKVDALLVAQVEEIIKPMGLTIEEITYKFFEWLVNPDTTDEAKAWMRQAIADENDEV